MGNANSGRLERALNNVQLMEIERRHLAGESLASLAKEYGVSGGVLTKKGIAERCRQVRQLATELAEVEQKVEAMSPGIQLHTRHLANELKAVSVHLASAAKYGSMTANRLTQLANEKSGEIDPVGDVDSNFAALRTVAAYTDVANKSANIGLNLLAANKKQVEEMNNGNIYDITPQLIPDDPVDAVRSYQRMLNG